MEKGEKIGFKKEISFRLTKPWCPAFHGYFWGFVVLFAVISIVIPIIISSSIDSRIIAISIGTYFIALMASSSIDISLSFTTINKASFTIYTFIFLIISFILFFLALYLSDFWGIFPAILGFLISLLVWIVANSDKDILNDEKHAKKLKESINETNDYYNLLNQVENDES